MKLKITIDKMYFGMPVIIDDLILTCRTILMSYTFSALLIIINCGPVVKLPTITELKFAMIPDDRNGEPPLTVAGSASTWSISDILLISSSLAFG